ncbi:MAG TPA: CpaF family protein, partial [Rhodocyclaceae bacterium]|nr:CpaF family protein [Rhodocyclaceae bacterium]
KSVRMKSNGLPPRAEPAPPSLDEQARALLNQHLKRVHQLLIKQMDLRRMDVSRQSEDELRATTRAMLEDIVNKDRELPPELDKARIVKQVLDEVVGLGPLEDLLADEQVTEIMVNRFDEIFIERAGRLSKSEITFTSDHAVIGAIERIVAPLGRRIDESSPMVDARLKDGSRVNAVIPPLALKGSNITIRKFSKNKLQGSDMVRFGSMTHEMLGFMQTVVENKSNIVISGGTGSGKTTLLNLLSSFIPSDERIITVEDAAELQLSQPNLIGLESRPPNAEGKGQISIRDLVKNTLRMRPDRIVVGECRGGEALDMLTAMNTGHDGSLTTAHANTPRDCLARIEVMVMMAGLDLPVRAIREQIASAIRFIVQQNRFSCGSRKITHITEITGMEGEMIQMQDIYLFRQEGFGADGKVKGKHIATGAIPDFYQDLKDRGMDVDLSVFQAGRVL